MIKKKIAVLTGTRAEYGLLRPLIREIRKNFKVQILVTGMHLSPEFGMTVEEIEKDDIPITERIEILLSTDSTSGIAKSMGLAMISFADVFNRLKPDLLIVLGDRFEVLSIVSTAAVMKIPVAHLHGGELTEGAVDDSIRHAITKLSHLHFTSTDIYRDRVIQMGEDPNRVFNVGAIGLDNIKKINFLKKEELEKELGIRFKKKIILITYHPVTLEEYSIEKQIDNLLNSLEQVNDCTLIFTKANADAEGRYINKRLSDWINDKKDAYLFDSLGVLKYLSVLKIADAIVGNSSSGIIEAPSLRTVTVNIGTRQKGRIKAESIIDVGYEKESIIEGIKRVQNDCKYKDKINFFNPYGNGNTSNLILHILLEGNVWELLNNKKFYDMGKV